MSHLSVLPGQSERPDPAELTEIAAGLHMPEWVTDIIQADGPDAALDQWAASVAYWRERFDRDVAEYDEKEARLARGELDGLPVQPCDEARYVDQAERERAHLAIMRAVVPGNRKRLEDQEAYVRAAREDTRMAAWRARLDAALAHEPVHAAAVIEARAENDRIFGPGDCGYPPEAFCAVCTERRERAEAERDPEDRERAEAFYADFMAELAARETEVNENWRAEAEARAEAERETRRMKRAGLVKLESGRWADHLIWLHHAFGDRGFTTRDVCDRGHDDPDWAGPPSFRVSLTDPGAPRMLGMAYQQAARRDYEGAWIEPGSVSRGVRRWQVTVKPVPTSPGET